MLNIMTLETRTEINANINMHHVYMDMIAVNFTHIPLRSLPHTAET